MILIWDRFYKAIASLNQEVGELPSRLWEWIREGRPSQSSRFVNDEVTEREARSVEKALAILVDALHRGVTRVEVQIGADFKGKTSPEAMRRLADAHARALVRDSRPAYVLSIQWADLLAPQDRIVLRLFAHRAASSTSPSAAKLPWAELEKAVKVEIVREVRFSLNQQSEISPGQSIAALTLFCCDPDVHALLAAWQRDTEAWHKAFRNLLAREGYPVPDEFFVAYEFEPTSRQSAPVGAGSIQFVVHREAPAGPRAGDASDSSATAAAADDAGTIEIGDDAFALVTWLGLGEERREADTPVQVRLPGIVNRATLGKTSLRATDPASLRVVSERLPIQVASDGQTLVLTGAVKEQNGRKKPIAFVVTEGGETPLEGSQRFPAGVAELLIGGKSDSMDFAPNGQRIRPVRIRIALKLSEPLA